MSNHLIGNRHAPIAVISSLVLAGACLTALAAPSVAAPTCKGEPATIVGTGGDDYIRGPATET